MPISTRPPTLYHLAHDTAPTSNSTKEPWIVVPLPWVRRWTAQNVDSSPFFLYARQLYQWCCSPQRYLLPWITIPPFQCHTRNFFAPRVRDSQCSMGAHASRSLGPVMQPWISGLAQAAHGRTLGHRPDTTQYLHDSSTCRKESPHFLPCIVPLKRASFCSL